MNERIWELFRQANHPHPKHGGDDMFFPEEFAELIVKECMNVCAEREDIRTRIKDDGKAAVAYMCRAYIKEHFGVEG
jgi:hypothetical protein